MSKDLFSKQAKAYAAGRPTYPAELFEYITGFTKQRNRAWDCATGNGQAAVALAEHFETVEATDISKEQIAQATLLSNVHYTICEADDTPFAPSSFDLITIATAYHWLSPESFAREARRVGKPGAPIAAWAYNLFYTDEKAVDMLIKEFYYEIINSYWDKERRHVEENYNTIEFPFDPLPTRPFHMTLRWDKERFLNYLSSWSAVQRYIDANGVSPLLQIEEKLSGAWPGSADLSFTFPLFLKLGRIS